MVKKRGFTIISGIVLILALTNLFLFFNKDGTSYATISGKFIEEVPELPFDLNISLIAFVIQWIVLLLIIITAYVHFLKHRKDEEYVKRDYSLLKQKKTKSKTDLDILYNLLQNKKILSTKTISELFGISKEKALEWAKILENRKLAIIEYPTFNDPEVRTYEKEPEKQKQGKEGEQKQGKKGKEGKISEQQKTEIPQEKQEQRQAEKTKRKTDRKTSRGKFRAKKSSQKDRKLEKKRK